MATQDLNGILTFLKESERLKDVLRSGHTSSGRAESTAEHTWRLCLWALVLGDRFDGVDLLRLLKICIVHDLGEALNGDIPAIAQSEDTDKSHDERADLVTLTASLPKPLQNEILELWDEYENAATPAARIAKGLDKLETIMQHNQGKNPADFDYAFNLDYGTQYTAADNTLAQIRAVLDEETRTRRDAASNG